MNWFRNLKLRFKLIAGFSVMIVLMGVIGVTGYLSTHKIQIELEEIFSVRLPSIDLLLQVDRDLQQLLVAERSMIFTNVESDTFKELKDEYHTNLKQADERWEKLKQLPSSSEEQVLMAIYERAHGEWRSVSRQVVEGRTTDTREGRRLALDLTLGSAKEKFEIMRDPIDKLTDLNLAIARNSREAARVIYNGIIKILVIMVAAGLCVGVAMVLIIGNAIATPVKAAVAGLKDIAEGDGDLTKRLQVVSRDEVGELAQWFNSFLDKLQALIKAISGSAETLGQSSARLKDLSREMTAGAGSMSAKSNTVATGAEEMSTSITSVAAAMEQASTNMESISAASGQMNSTIAEIAQRTEKARTITSEAVHQTESAFKNVDELGAAAKAISQVTEVITEISEQTNLLALNATIEAARAGEAGKGFAVVANEIKELARQTASSTQEIKTKIEGIQGATEQTVRQIGQISAVIKDVSDIVSTIAAATEEQSTATKEIAGSVSQASSGIQEVNQNVALSSTTSSSIAEDIAGINQETADMTARCSQVDANAQELSQQAIGLMQLVRRFKV
jgi:methyl-accepting chemotaxis protein